jgi:hypothetical protein
MDKTKFLEEIKRIATNNQGQAPGWQAFASATGLRKSDWYPHLWLRWGDALTEAGCVPNEFQTKISDDDLVEKYIQLVRELGRFPVEGEIRRKARAELSFPNHSTFRRFGGKDKLREAVAAYCRRTPGCEDVLSLCAHLEKTRAVPVSEKREPKVVTEFVYLMKPGKHYKIGRTKSLGRRGSELAIKIPVPPKTIHGIETDDPVGVEAYWHRRFVDKRGEGEWFALSLDDVTAFKRWRRIV